MRLEAVSLSSTDHLRVVLDLSDGSIVTLGRLPAVGITSPQVSREHAFVRQLLATEPGTAGGVGQHGSTGTVELRAGKKSVAVVWHGRGAEPHVVLHPGERTQLRAGDRLYLEHAHDVLASGFVVRSGSTQPATASSTAAGNLATPPAPSHIDAQQPGSTPAPATPTLFRAGCHASGPCEQRSTAAGGMPRGASIASALAGRLVRKGSGGAGGAACPAARAAQRAAERRASKPVPASQSSAAVPPATPSLKAPHSPAAPQQRFLHGVSACFWAKAHTRPLRALIRAAGAAEHDTAAGGTTHVVLGNCALTAAGAAARLAREQQEAALAKQAQQERGGDGGRRGPGGARGIVTERQTPETPSQSSVAQQSGGLPAGVCFVTPDYLSACLAARRRLPEGPFLTRFRPPLESASGTPQPGSPPQSPLVSVASAGRSDELAAPRTPPATPPRLPAAGNPLRHEFQQQQQQQQQQPSQLLQQQQQPSQQQPPSQQPHAPASSSAPAVVGTGQRSSLPGPLPDLLGPRPLSVAEEHVVPDASQICTSLDEWGVDDRWTEPWDEEKARDTLKKLYEVWQPGKRSRWEDVVAQLANGRGRGKDSDSDSNGGGSAAAPATAVEAAIASARAAAKRQRVGDAQPEGTGSMAAAWQQQQQERPGGSGAVAAPRFVSRNGRCVHVACSAHSFCFVSEMQRTMRNYGVSKEERYKKKAITKCISALEQLTEPIREEEDVDRLLYECGDKTREKVRDILAGEGVYWRNELRENNERIRTILFFKEVWGAGQSTAESWYNRGCRTLEDLAALPDLTNMQRVGIRHHNDFQIRVPRWETEEVVGIIKEEFLQVLAQVTGLTPEVLRNRLHVRGAGSYWRGRSDSSDIDMIIAPPPVAYEAPRVDPVALEPRPLLNALLERLLARGLITDEMIGDAFAAKEHSTHHAIFLGVWRGPSHHDIARRLDIWLYPWRSLPTAINTFCSSTNFSRAIRHYAKWGAPRNPASALNAPGSDYPVGTFFRLRDNDLAPYVMVGDVRQQAGPPLQLRCETDLFNALGLHYVPPHMRPIHW